MIHLPEYIFLEDRIKFQIKNISNQSLSISLKELDKKLMEKKFPIHIWKHDDTTIYAEITYLIEDKEICDTIRRLVGACVTNNELYDIIFEIIKSELLLKLGSNEQEVEIKRIKNHKGNEFEFGPKRKEKKKWKIPKRKFLKLLNRNYKEKKKIFHNQDIQFQRSYFMLPCVKPLLALGVVKGKRNFGAKVIAFACISEGLTKDEAKIVGKYYFDRINSTDFSLEEVLTWINWVYRKENIHWSCKTPQDMGECDKSICWVVKNYYSGIF